MGANGPHTAGSVFHDDVGCFGKCSGSIHDIIYQYHVPSGYISHQCHFTYFIWFVALFVADHEVGTQEFRIGSHPSGTSGIGGGHGQIRKSQFFQVGYEDRRGKEVVDRDIEESLDLVGMEIDGDDALHPGG